MGGDGWSPSIKNFLNGHIQEWIPDMNNKVDILTTDQLIQANLKI
jgi:hypothetical protein